MWGKYSKVSTYTLCKITTVILKEDKYTNIHHVQSHSSLFRCELSELHAYLAYYRAFGILELALARSNAPHPSRTTTAGLKHRQIFQQCAKAERLYPLHEMGELVGEFRARCDAAFTCEEVQQC